MKRLLLILPLVFLMGCSSTYLSTTGKSLLIAEDTYDTGMSACAKLYKDGSMNEEQKAKVILIGNSVKHLLVLARDSWLAYAEDQSDENKKSLQSWITLVAEDIVDFTAALIELGVNFNDPS